jgi:hypothetical protein
MENSAERSSTNTGEQSDPARVAWAAMLRAAILAIPPHWRETALADNHDLLPGFTFEKSRAPQRGGQVLNNVYELFKLESKSILAAPEVREKLEKTGKPADIQSVRNALTYLQGRSILRRIGYGKYQLEDGRIIDGAP